MRKFKFSNINRRHLTLIGLVMIIEVAGYINVNYTEDAIIIDTGEILEEQPIKEIEIIVNADIPTKTEIEEESYWQSYSR